ncbi:hypothetical protein RB595_003892 [Gaeumannomyces hyphopodioides]
MAPQQYHNYAAGPSQQRASLDPAGHGQGQRRPGSSSGNTTQFEYGHNPNAHVYYNAADARLPAFGGEFQPGLFRPADDRRFGNPAPLGLSAFALTTFVLSAVNLGAGGLSVPDIAVPLALGYGGLVQLLAGMWEMAVGNTFGATALSSYGGFWVARLEHRRRRRAVQRGGLRREQQRPGRLPDGLVRLHDYPAAVHAPVDRYVPSALLYARYGLPDAGLRAVRPRRRRRRPRALAGESRRGVWHAVGVSGVVQCVC